MSPAALPSRARLAEAYSRLQIRGERPPSVEELVGWAQWARLDPRLGEILVRYFVTHFREIHPTLLWEKNRDAKEPQALAALVDFSRTEAKSALGRRDRAAFEAWAQATIWKLEPGPPQMFFVREGTPRPQRDEAESRRSLKAFRRWGYLGSSEPLSPKSLGGSTLLGPKERMVILSELIKSQPRFTVEDYIRACGGRVHRRAAERDLQSHPRLQRRGSTRAAMYAKKKAKKSRPKHR